MVNTSGKGIFLGGACRREHDDTASSSKRRRIVEMIIKSVLYMYQCGNNVPGNLPPLMLACYPINFKTTKLFHFHEVYQSKLII
jgi:hypothetical protein